MRRRRPAQIPSFGKRASETRRSRDNNRDGGIAPIREPVCEPYTPLHDVPHPDVQTIGGGGSCASLGRLYSDRPPHRHLHTHDAPPPARAIPVGDTESAGATSSPARPFAYAPLYTCAVLYGVSSAATTSARGTPSTVDKPSPRAPVPAVRNPSQQLARHSGDTTIRHPPAQTCGSPSHPPLRHLHHLYDNDDPLRFRTSTAPAASTSSGISTSSIPAICCITLTPILHPASSSSPPRSRWERSGTLGANDPDSAQSALVGGEGGVGVHGELRAGAKRSAQPGAETCCRGGKRAYGRERVWRRIYGTFKRRAQRQAARRANDPRETCSELAALSRWDGRASVRSPPRPLLESDLDESRHKAILRMRICERKPRVSFGYTPAHRSAGRTGIAREKGGTYCKFISGHALPQGTRKGAGCAVVEGDARLVAAVERKNVGGTCAEN
ncbi:hypothetical protein C8J57DRAFT_1227907 [Mycena rebaudengoi]|nr:hypothetical protein C8J57DRAFT_1227907 [Mycena rebaudengoi]